MISTFNILTGKLEFNIESIDNTNNLITNSDHIDMLSDSERNRRYHIAISNVINKLNRNKKLINILDIGTGSGILSYISSSHSNQSNIDAFELFKPLADLAIDISKYLKFNNINIYPYRSDDPILDTLPLNTPYDLIVTELFDSELLGEGILPTLRNIKRLCNENVKIVPYGAKVYGQLFKCDYLKKAIDAEFSMKINNKYIVFIMLF